MKIENNNAPFLTRNDEGDLVESFRPYHGKIPVPVLDYLNHRMAQMDRTGFCYPMDAMDLYNTVYVELEKVAEKLDPAKLVNATPETYLCGVAKKMFQNFWRAEVLPRRRDYRASVAAEDEADAEAQAKAERDAPEGDDAGLEAYAEAAEGYTAELGASSMTAQPLTIQQLADKLPAEESAEERRAAARMELSLICEELPDIVVRAFAGYIAANGNLLEAAQIAHISKNTMYKNWKKWILMARKVAKKGK